MPMKGNPTWEMMNFYCRSHPWHGVEIGDNAPEEINCYIEIVPTDTVKFEIDKKSGLLKADRPQKYSNYCPSLYGFIPQTHSGKRVGDYTGKKLNRKDIKGDDDPLDICVFSEKEILRGDILLTAIPIGGIRAIDGDEADDKILAVLKDDLIYKDLKDIDECPSSLIERLKHYFLTYKDFPEDLGKPVKRKMEITHVYNRQEALEIIRLGCEDYNDLFAEMKARLKDHFK
jgi:inorganic pyrophosphatase